MTTKTDRPQILSDNVFPVVGIGASAGGLEAFKKFLKAIPEDSGMAYVLVQHLAPDRESALPDLLQRVTTIPVLEITDDVKVRPNHIYIIPSNKMLVANDGVLQLSPRPDKSEGGRNLPIDLFFTSLAEIHQAHAIGVVLSGSASDGTAGLKAIKAHGGLTFAQDEASADYDGMPQSAAQAGVVDFILPPEEIPAKLAELRGQLTRSDSELDNSGAEEEQFRKILALVRFRKGADFTYYKRPTVRRRIFRRMVITKTATPGEYYELLQKNMAEQDALYRDLLISVTSFFRDEKIFDDLCNSVFPHIAEDKAPGERLRIWVAGCSTGEEAYSMAICLKEFFGSSGRQAQVFATDISERAITKARYGFYTESEVAGVSEARLRSFFTQTEGGYVVNKAIREMCIFAPHDFLKDPPFGKLDLVSCRNVLIYMEPYLQKKALATFHYALLPKRFLLLGKSETSSSVPALFLSTGTKDKLYTRKDMPSRYMTVASPSNEQKLHDKGRNSSDERMQTDYQKTADDILLSHYTPAGVVINEAMDIVHFRGATGEYLEQGPGKPSHNLLKMARTGLAFELRSAIQRCRKEGKTIIKEAVPMLTLDGQRAVTIEALPLPGMLEPHCLVLFRDTPVVPAPVDTGAAPSGSDDAKDLRIRSLEKELAQAREEMRSITEDQEAVNEELQSANEELLSGSEELQSLNEELETSKEEVQSTNEELTVVNQELVSMNIHLHVAVDAEIKAVKKLEAQALMTHNLLMMAPALVCTMRGPDHVYDLINDRYQSLFGKREIKGKPMLEALPELVGQGFDTLLDEVYNTGKPFVGIDVPISLAGDEHTAPEQRYFNFSYQPMYDEDKKIYAVLVFGYEVTDQFLAKNKLQELHQAHTKELEGKVQQRTRELSVANELLQKKNTELLSFTYVSSHDLQEPLRKIQTFVSRILSKEYDALSDDGKDTFQRINNAAHRMQTLIQDLLTYSHASVADRKFEKTDLRKIVTEVVADHQAVIEEKSATAEIGNLCSVVINDFQFRQVIHNLISNALKFSREGVAPHIHIQSESSTGLQLMAAAHRSDLSKLVPNKHYCHISFKDNGIGFDQQYNEKIFEVFQRLHDKADFEGTGIGLAIVKKIVEHHDGLITATGAVNEGATFDIYIPSP